MQTVDFGHDIPPMSRLIYGAWRLADDQDQSAGHIVSKVEACLDQGITTFDHADIYGYYVCEQMFGDALRNRGDLKSRMQIISKCGIMLNTAKFPERRVKYYDTSASHIRDSVDNSLKRIGVDVIDILLIHRPDPLMDHHETGQVLDALIAEGKIRGAGVSNFMRADVELLQSAMKNPLLTNQVEISIIQHEPFKSGVVAQWQRLGRPLMAWSPLSGGSLFAPSDPVGRRVLPRLVEIGDEFGVAADAVALAWLMTHPANIMPVVGTNKLHRIETISDALKVTMDRQTWYELWTLAEGAEVP